MNLLLLFIILNIANVMLQTFKTLCTVNSGKWMAAFMNALAFGFYTIVIVYMMCDLPLLVKAGIVGACNLIGVFIVKYLEERHRKDKLWKIEFTVKEEHLEAIKEFLSKSKVPYNYIRMPQNYVAFYVFCSTRDESRGIQKLINNYNAKYFVSESKSLI